MWLTIAMTATRQLWVRLICKYNLWNNFLILENIESDIFLVCNIVIFYCILILRVWNTTVRIMQMKLIRFDKIRMVGYTNRNNDQQTWTKHYWMILTNTLQIIITVGLVVASKNYNWFLSQLGEKRTIIINKTSIR